MSKQKKVFIIDDSIRETNVLRAYFSSDYKVLPLKQKKELKKYSNAFNSIEALTTYVKDVIQNNYRDLRLIVSDIFFEGDLKDVFDGINLIKLIRDWKIDNAHPDYCKFIPIIATSKVTEKDYLTKAYTEAKATLYIDKGHKDQNGKILGLTDVGKQLIPPFDSWCEMVGDSRYKIAFSFTGKDNSNNEDHRAFIREIAESLSRRCRTSVYFDEFYEPDNNTKTGNLLSNVYRSQSEKIVVFLSNEYNDPSCNVWTSEEWTCGIKQYIQETSLDNLCLISLSPELDKEKVLQRLFSEIGDDNIANEGGVKVRNRIYKDISEQRDYYYSIISNKTDTAPAAFHKYNEFKKEKLKTVVDFIIDRFNLKALVRE